MSPRPGTKEPTAGERSPAGRSRGRVTSAADAAATISPGSTVGFGGILNAAHPMALVRELIRQGVGDLHLVSIAGGVDLDLLIAAGLVSEVTTPTISAESLGPGAAYAFRRAAERGEIVINEVDEGILQVALQAAAQRISFAPWPAGLGTSLPERNPNLFEFESPDDGRLMLGVRALHLDAACVHAARSDPFGNVQPIGSGFGDKSLARAATTVIATVERIVPNELIRRSPAETMISGADLVVHAPFGSHPFSSPGVSLADKVWIADYLAAAEAWYRSDDRAPLDGFLAEWVTGPADHWRYLERVGLDRLYALEEGLHP